MQNSRTTSPSSRSTVMWCAVCCICHVSLTLEAVHLYVTCIIHATMFTYLSCEPANSHCQHQISSSMLLSEDNMDSYSVI